ncbi:MAG: hypothetical protein P8L22_00530 [Acidimicrobiales bacterium]|nr:hypothetical protein [Acidimicrobiales bacterium]
MLTQPTTDKILLAIADDLNAVIAPAIEDEQAKVLLGQAEQLLRRLSRRSASEIAWMVEEIAQIEEAIGQKHSHVDGESLLLCDVAERYSQASQALAEAIDEAFETGDNQRLKELKQILSARIAREQEILGHLEMVGRG